MAPDHGDVAGYHYYPGREQVVQWLAGEGLTVIDEGFKWEDGWAIATSCCAEPPAPSASRSEHTAPAGTL
jgi:hypothetical protein